MRTLNTKSGREEARNSKFEMLTAKGLTRETYKDVEIFTGKVDDKFYLSTFIGTSSKMVHNFYSSRPFTSKIEEIKSSADRREGYKAQRKAERKTEGRTGAAVSIREELKTAFPGVKFSVKSESFAGGDSVRISWTDGPTDESVSAITRKYQSGSYNGMEDIYEYTNTRKDIPQSKYVQTSRTISEGVYAIVNEQLAQKFSEDTLPHEIQRMAYQIVNKNFIPIGAVVNGIVSTGQNCGLAEDIYALSFEGFDVVESAPSLSQVAAQVAAEEAAADVVAVEPGTVQIIQYSERSIAVIGETKAIKDKLKALGGKFNFRLTCGPGWIFSLGKLQAVTDFLSAQAQPEKSNDTQPGKIEDQPETTTLKDEVSLTINALAEMDLQNNGVISESFKECARVQGVDLNGVQIYKSVEEIEKAAESGKVISLLNYHDLLNSGLIAKA